MAQKLYHVHPMRDPIPAEIMRHRGRGTEIVRRGSRYYAYRVTSVWDKKRKRVRKITLGYIGPVLPDGIRTKTGKDGDDTHKQDGSASVQQAHGEDDHAGKADERRQGAGGAG